MSVAIPCIGSYCPSFLTSPSSEGIVHDSLSLIIRGWKPEELWGLQTITLGRPVDDAFFALREVYKDCCQADWDGYGASAVTEDAYKEAEKIINLLPSSIKIPEITAEPTGEIGLEWRRGRGQVFIISVGGRHRINYAGIFGGNKTHGSEYFEETLPSIIIEHLRRLYA